MVVSETIGQEALFLGIACLVGAGLFFLYDMLRIFRRIIPHGNIWIGVEDFIYWLICTGTVFVMLYRENDGMVRGFAIGGLVLGMLFYYLLLSRYVVRFQVKIIKTVIGVLQKIFSPILRPVLRGVKKVYRIIRKRLKKLIQAVKMGLCKL